jgi:hypothetical protein
MNNTLLNCLLAILLLAPGGAARAFVYETAYELQGDGDFNGDGLRDLIIVDKATGNYRLAYQLSPGLYTWVSPRASGILPVSSLAIGRLIATNQDALALTGPEANRVNILDASSPSSAGLPASAFIPSLGPNVVGAIDMGGSGNTAQDDLYVGSIYNDSGSAPHETLLRNDGTNRTLIADNVLSPVTSFREKANQVTLKTNATVRLGLWERNTTTNSDTFRAYSFPGGSPLESLSIGALITASRFDYVHGQFATTNPLCQFLFFSAGFSVVWGYQVQEPSPGLFSFGSLDTFNFTNALERLVVLPGTNETKLLAIFSGGSSAAVYKFDGVNPPVPVQQIAADSGEHFTGAGVLGQNGFMAYSAPLGQGVSSRFKQWNWNGSSYTAGASGSLPGINQFTASGNVLQFRFEPFVTNVPQLLRINNAGDWSSQPVISPPFITVKTESFAGPTQGLINPTPVALGKTHPLAHFGLANQYSNMISLFSFTPPQGDKVSEVNISPAPGSYPAAVTLSFTASDPTHLIYFRIGGGAPWTQFTGQPVHLYTNATVQYYGQPLLSLSKSAIRSAAYSFTTGPATLDSNKDGVPDYVAAAVGLNPSGPRDADADGYSDLEELLHGTNPLDNTSVPTNYPHLDDQAAFDLAVTPLPWDGYSNTMTLCSTGVAIRAYNLQGAYLGVALTTNPPLPTARLTNIAVDPFARLIVNATEMHYGILTTNTNSIVGREMIGLVSVPALTPFTVPYSYVGTNPVLEASNWIAAASNAWLHLTRAVITSTLTVNDSLEALLFEQAVAGILGARSNFWWTNLTLFPYRVSDVARTNPSQPMLLALETNLDATHRGYQLKAAYATITNLVETSLAPPIESLRAVVRDIYRIDSLLNNTNPATFASPIDEIRRFLWFGTLESNYLYWASTAGQLASASSGAASILAAVVPRPTTQLTLLVRNDTFDLNCRLLDQPGTNAPCVLLNPAGLPFKFPDNFELPPGSQVEVFGYTDVTSPLCPYPAIEVISIALAAVPIASDQDSDGNLLIDSWEFKFFGHLGVDPFADSDGDGYSNLQEVLDGSDPNDKLGIPAGPVIHFAPPMLTLIPDGAFLRLQFDWPAAYIGQIVFHAEATAALGLPFSDLGAIAPTSLGGDHWEITVALPPDPVSFYVVTLALAPP